MHKMVANGDPKPNDDDGGHLLAAWIAGPEVKCLVSTCKRRKNKGEVK